MSSKIFLKALLQTSAIVAVTIGSATAQEGQTDENGEKKDEVVVTGSRIKRDTFSSPVSMDVLTVEDAKIEGIADIAGLLQTATAASGSNQVTSAVSTAFVANGGLGAENVGLRGLDARRTLDLINGRRAGPSGVRGSVGSFDLNSIPLVGVERVDILKDGASSVYGSDAIAGVINYVTDKSDGGEIDLFTSIAEEGGGEVYRGSATYGKTFENGRFRITGDYIKEEELAREDRSYLDCNQNYSFTDSSLSTRADVIDPRTGEPQCAGTIWGHVWVYDYGADNLARNPRNIILQFDRDGTLGNHIPGIPTSLDGSGVVTPPGWFQVEYFARDIRVGRSTNPADPNLPAWAGIDVTNNNQNAVTDLYPEMQRRDSVTPEQERFTLMFDGDYEFSNGITAYTEALYNRRTNYQNGHKQYWTYQYGEDSFIPGINSNPIAAGWGGPLSWFSPTPIVEHGDQETEIDYFRLVGGLKGEIGEGTPFTGWSWDIYGQHSNSDAKYTEQIIRADAIFPYNFTTSSCVGQTSPGATTTLASGEVVTVEGRPCVDLRWFDPDFLAGELTQAERDFLLDEDTGTTKYTQTTFEGFVTGDVMQVPAGTLSAAFGAFYQRDSITDRPSDTTLTGNEFFGSQAGITTGVQETLAAYSEISFPLVRDKPFFEDLSITASGRYNEITSKHEDGRSIKVDGFNYRATADWRISPLVRVRGSHGTSFRAPGLFEQFLANESSSARQNIDPCIGWGTALIQGDITQQTATNCAAAGIADDYIGAPISISVLQGGGFGLLEPETSTNYTVGFVFTPDFADLSFAVDYFDITIDDEISTLSAANIIAGCYGSQNFATEPLCDLITRGFDLPPGDPSITVIERIHDVTATFINVNSQKNTGLDFTLRYGKDTKYGRFDLSSQFTRQIKDEVQLLGESAVQFRNGGVGEPKWTGFANLNFDPGKNWTVRYGIDYIGKQNGLRNRFSQTPEDLLPTGGGEFTVLQDGQTVFWKTDLEATIYHNLSAQYNLDSGWTIRGGVNNLFDEHPPASSSDADLGNTPIVSQFELLGRRFFLNISKKFN